ncbi:protein DDI1 homolog 2 isoform X4 [Cyclopterus lumpus]|uniref:protein DDI1 homolog 2 isoform X4 n=1 Tax=Cyclopterus lumpus TaxID=8103 RepID=UPI0014861BAD|nr:protein DDI1 homolog 2 isoform X4 [Cyclopterus lumpus]
MMCVACALTPEQDSTDAFGDSWRETYQPDTADGQTTSPQPPPPPFTLPRTLGQTSSSASPSQSPSSGQPQLLVRSQSDPATMEQASAPELCHDQPGHQGLPQPSSSAVDAGCTPNQVHPHPVSVHTDSKVTPVPSPLPDVLRTCTPPVDMTTVFQYPGSKVQPGHTEGNAESDKVMNSPKLLQPEELFPIQTMEQEATESDTTATEACLSVLSRPDSVEMESPTASQGVMSSGRDQPEGEHCASSDSVPSLAAALMELHELLVSNNQAQSQNCGTSCSPLHPFNQETEEVTPKPRTPMPENTRRIPSTAILAGCASGRGYSRDRGGTRSAAVSRWLCQEEGR